MSIGDRFIHLLRSNLTALLSKSSDSSEPGGRGQVRIEDLSDDELERELSRRRRRREAAERAAQASGSVEQEAWAEAEEAMRGGSGQASGRTRNRQPGAGGRMAGRQDHRLARLYAQLECPYGANLDTVRKQYRVLMRKYHPDMHSNKPEKQRLATELSQRLTVAYNELRQVLSGS